jgi:hypothetical protein
MKKVKPRDGEEGPANYDDAGTEKAKGSMDEAFQAALQFHYLTTRQQPGCLMSQRFLFPLGWTGQVWDGLPVHSQ